jgi:hypothetical protein
MSTKRNTSAKEQASAFPFVDAEMNLTRKNKEEISAVIRDYKIKNAKNKKAGKLKIKFPPIKIRKVLTVEDRQILPSNHKSGIKSKTNKKYIDIQDTAF